MKNTMQNVCLYVGDKQLNSFMNNFQLNDNGMKLFGGWCCYECNKITKTIVKKLIKKFDKKQDVILGMIITDKMYWFNDAYKVFSNGVTMAWKTDIKNEISNGREEVKI